MNVTVLTTDPGHPVVPSLEKWKKELETAGHQVRLCFDKQDVAGTEGDILFLVSCGQLVSESDRAGFKAALVLHASDLPNDRGWSPHIWAIVEGAASVTVCLLEAREPVDSGPIWLKRSFTLEGHELLPEINGKLFEAELALMSEAVHRFSEITPAPQRAEPGSYRQKRTPEHSRLDPGKTIAEQFDLLRVVDNSRYPAFFEYRGRRYKITIEKSATNE